MEIRELVKLKKGVGGLQPPENFGILLDRERAGKDHVAVVFTLKGILKVKWKFLKDANGVTYHDNKHDEKKMREFLNDAVKKEEKQNTLKMDPQQMIESIQPEGLWRSVSRSIEENRTDLGIKDDQFPYGCHDRFFTPAEIGKIHFKPSYLGPKQEWAVGRILSKCDDRGEPYFLRKDIDRKPHYFVYSKETLSSMNYHIQKLEDLRSMFLEWVEEEDEFHHRTRRVPKLKVDDISSVKLGIELYSELERICGWAIHYLENGWWPVEISEIELTKEKTVDPFGLAGTPIRRLHKFDLEQFILFLSMDLTSTRRKDLPSSLVTLLLELGKINWKEASELIVKFNMGSGAREFHEVFPPHVLRSSEDLPDQVTKEDEEGRADLTDLETHTIDPVDAKDFDDAISIIKDGENTVVWVHIADVSHYVRPSDLVDSEARFRATSVYLPTRVIPMLPRKLSENLCSLRENVHRLSLSTRIVLSPHAEVLEWEHVQSVIEVNKNLNYDQVNEWIHEEKEPFISLHELAVKLESRGKRLHLNTPERRIRFSGGSEIDIQIKRPTKATKLIEELMVLTNECSALFLEQRELPLPFRVHPLPERTSTEKFNAACEALELDVEIEANWGDEKSGNETNGEDAMLRSLRSGGKIDFGISPPTDNDEESKGSPLKPTKEIMDSAVDAYNEVLDDISQLKEDNVKDMLNLRLLRTLSRAFYSDVNYGHFGLRSMSYCHFTSPIRRYPDILVHRAIKSVISEEGGGPPVGWYVPEKDEIEDNMDHINDMTGSAEEWERDMVDVALATRARMTQGFFKGTHSGMITSLTPSSCFVLLDDGVTEGRLSIRHMSKYPLTVDEHESRILVELTNEMLLDPKFRNIKDGEEPVFLKLGDRIKCSIRSVSIAEGKIGLSLQ